jgi:hypothetical protein
MELGGIELLTLAVLLMTLIAALLSWQRRSFGIAALFGLLFLIAMIAAMNSPLGEQIRKELREDKAAASRLNWAG